MGPIYMFLCIPEWLIFFQNIKAVEKLRKVDTLKLTALRLNILFMPRPEFIKVYFPGFNGSKLIDNIFIKTNNIFIKYFLGLIRICRIWGKC